MFLTGTIANQKRVRAENQECYGTCIAFKQTFRIRISNAAFDDPVLFADTLLHELIHLWFSIVMARCQMEVSERRQHQVIEKFVPRIALRFKQMMIDRAEKLLKRRKQNERRSHSRSSK